MSEKPQTTKLERVRVSQLAIERGIFRQSPKGRLGTIIPWGNAHPREDSANVLWDGNKTAQTVARCFLEVVENETGI